MKIDEHDALIVVDVQRDFCPGGALAVNDGDAVVPIINRITPRFRRIVFTRDWHPKYHCSFSAQPQWVDGSWPAHCVQNTPGADFHPDLSVPKDALIISKATQPDKDAYSGFDQTNLAADLRRFGVTRINVCGLATDYCVKASALDAVKEGFETVVIEDACRGVDIPAGSSAAALDEMRTAGVKVCNSEDLV